MTEINREPNNILEIGSAIFAILAYMSSYRSVIEPFVPGDAHAKLQVGILGLLLLGVAFELLYLSSIRFSRPYE